MIILKLALNLKSILKLEGTRKENLLKTISHEKSPPEKSTNFHEIQRNFHDSVSDNN